MAKEICNRCKFYKKYKDSDRDRVLGNGQCLRFPPSLEIGPNSTFWTWPKTADNEWCGEWKLMDDQIEGN